MILLYALSFSIRTLSTTVNSYVSFVTLDHKTSHLEIEIYTSHTSLYESYESWINKLSIDDIWLRYNYLKIWNLRVQKNLNIEKIAFKVVQMKFLAMHITKQKLSFDIVTVGNLQNIFMVHDFYLMS